MRVQRKDWCKRLHWWNYYNHINVALDYMKYLRLKDKST